MSLINEFGTSTALVATFPPRIFTRSGASLDPQEDLWEWVDGPFNARINFRWYTNGFEIFVPALKFALIPYVKGYSCRYVEHLETIFRKFVRVIGECPGGPISTVHISKFREKLLPHERWRLGIINVLFQKWVKLGLPGVDPECATFLAKQRKIKNKTGEAVRTRNPITGPLSEEEYTALHSAANAAYGRNDLPLWCLILTRLLFACGGRISQYASLKLCDFDRSSLVLKLPQAKTREVHTRKSFLEFDLSPHTGRLIEEYIDGLLEQGAEENSALFPEVLVKDLGTSKSRAPDDLFLGHCSPGSLSQRFRIYIAEVAPPTSRLNYALLPISPRRLRYTFGVRLAEEGASRVVIANRLGHADLQSVDVYFAASPKIVENIDRAMGGALAPLANAFKGQLVANEDDTTHRGARGSRIIDFRISTAPVGSCAGKGQGCGFNKPVACYTCFRFEPWLDAPHEKVLKRLLDEREKWTGDERMAAVNDEPIRAVEEVIALCTAALQQRQGALDEVSL